MASPKTICYTADGLPWQPTTEPVPLTGRQLLDVHEDAEMIRLLNAGIQPDGSYETCPELRAKFERDEELFAARRAWLG
jgi:hypothetical protein